MRKLPRAFSYFCNSEKGAIQPIVALTIPVLFGMVALGTDASLWVAQKRELQTAADSAVLAAGWELAQASPDYMDYAAFKEAVNNGYEPNSNGDLLLEILNETDEGVTISVTLSQDARTFFSQIIFREPVRISAAADALISGSGGQFCIMSLEDEDSGAFTTSGTVEIFAPDCGLVVNSEDDDAVLLSGNVDLTLGSVRISGDYTTRGAAVDFYYDSINTDSAPLDDPYADLEVPSYSGCDESGFRMSSGGTLSPGVYCDGLDISGNNDVELEPGVYIIDGGSFKVTGSGDLYGEGVTIIVL